MKESAYILQEIVEEIPIRLKIHQIKGNIIRIHTKKLELLGEISFPLNTNNWHQLINNKEHYKTILEYAGYPNIDSLITVKKIGKCELRKAIIYKDNIHLYLERGITIKNTIEQCNSVKENYGALSRSSKINPSIELNELTQQQLNKTTLTDLRRILLKKVIENLCEFNLNNESNQKTININLNTKTSATNEILCGSVLTEQGTKDINTSAQDLYDKRSSDMRLMAEHKYGLRNKTTDELWTNYFKKLGEAAVTIELIQNKPHKNLKINLNNCSSTNKGAAFIFYNCARLSALFNEFDKKVSENVYEKLVPLEDVDFTLLTEPEEWELFYVYIMQYPLLIESCIKDIERGIINPHYLVSFLSNMCSIFSTYYRRVRILIAPRAHLMPTLQARIYLLKTLEHIFHKTLKLLNIDPIKEM